MKTNTPSLLLAFVALAFAAFTHPTNAAPGDVDAAFNPNVNSTVLSTSVQPDGKILIGGSFSAVGGVTRNGLARINADGSLDASFNPNVGGTVTSTAVLADGKILIAGSFTTVGGVARNYLARLNTDGTLDTSFNPNVDGITPSVYSTLIQPDGKIVIAGDFTTVGGVTRNNIARFNADGALDAGFNPNVGSAVYSVARQADGKIVIGGSFGTVGGVAHDFLARINADGTLDPSLSLNVGHYVYSTAVQADGKIVIGGEFTNLGGVTRNHLARLNGDGTLDTGFNPNADGAVISVAVQADGKLVIGGGFTTVGAVTRNYIARLNTDGATDSGFNPNASSTVSNTAVQADGKIVIGGSFGTVSGVARSRLARLENDAAPQSLTVQGNARVQWLRGGASPESVQVNFEFFPDGANWVTLGTGTRISGDWELTGLGLPVTGGGQIRARARTTGGEYSGSSGLVEALAPYGTQPEIALEQPALTNIPDGGTKDFGDVLPGGNASLTFTVRNTGNANLTGLGITFDGANASDFTITASPTAPVTGPNGSTTFTLRFAPTAVGARTAALHIASNDFDENPFDINLTGTGAATDIAVEQPAMTIIGDGGTRDFGGVVVGASTSMIFTIRNTGTADLTFLSPNIGGLHTADFTVTSPPIAPLMAGSITTLTVQFAPTTLGTRTADVNISSNVAGSKNPYTVNLTGTGVAPDIAVEQPALANIPDGATKTFGNVPVGSNTSLTFTVRNTGNANLTGLGITFDGANASDFTITTNPTAPVAVPNGTTTFVVRYSPTTAGTRTAALHIANNDPDENPYDINLTGTATAPEIGVEQPALTNIADGGGNDFGSVVASSNTSLTFTIRNTGNGDLTGLVITKDGTNAADFTVTTNPTAPVVPGASTTFIVRFAPSGTGVRTAALHIANNDPDENPFDISLTGTGAGAGNADAAFGPDANSYVLSTAVQTDGKIIVGGGFTTVGGVTRNYIARLNAVGTLDTGFNPGANDWVFSTALQVNGQIVIGGSFTNLAGVTRNYIARLNADGALDTGFNPDANDWIFSTVVQANGKIVIGGSFTSLGGVTRNRAARLNADGTLDASFNPDVDGDVYSMALQPDGKVVIGGAFATVGGVARNRLARVNADGTLDASFNANANGSVYNATIQADGKIIIGGNFTAMGGTTRNHLARLNGDGTLDGFNPNVNSDVDSTAVQADGKVIIGGSFTAVGAVARNYLARVNADGTLDTAFNPNASSSVFSTAIQADGKIIIGGDFTNVGGVPGNRLARLENDAATQSLTTPNASRVQWLRGGASPESVQVNFELSTNDGGTWTPLGAGTRSRLVTGWELTGLSLPGSGQVRARAQITGGYSNCSSGFVETVAAITGTTPTPEIAVEQPAPTNVVDGGSKDFGNALLGGSTSLIFTIKNTGTADLTGLGITFDGTNAADFSVTASPATPVSGPNGSTTFTVRFAPASAGVKIAALHIASNVTGSKNPYDINLSGRALAPNGDDDGDGITNATELALAALGFDPLVNSAALLTTLQNNALGVGLYTAADMQTLALGSPLLERNVATGHFHLSIGIEKSPNLLNWTPLTGFTPTYDAQTGRIDIDFAPGAMGPQFYRVLGAKP